MDDIMPEIAALVPYACHKSALGRYITEAAPNKKRAVFSDGFSKRP